MAKVTINKERCKGCGLCTSVCPKKIIVTDTETLNDKGYRPAKITEPDKCIGCAFCATICPDCVITIEK